MEAAQAIATVQEHTAELQLHVQDLPKPKATVPIAVQVMEGITFSAIVLTFSYIYSVIASTLI